MSPSSGTMPFMPGIRRPRKSLGQHFLVDSRVANRIVAAADLTDADTVVEIGPGNGVLTRRLVERAGRVVAVELDQRLAAELPARLGMPGNLEVHHGDARTVAIEDLVGLGNPYKMIANLPYYAASPITRRFLESEQSPDVMVVMLQREVGEAMTAKPGAMTLLSVATQIYAEASVVTHVPARSFRPPPKVSSTVVKLKVRSKAAAPVEDVARFFALVRAGFAAPRKQLRNSLAQGTGAPAEVVSATLDDAGIDERRRPATLTLAEWGNLNAVWPPEAPRSRAN
ncbi:MAG: ribosomal RNA small subunit methyltransferase A [Chloroflexi bacterium]|nr:ribosomal RNA small subunit methyltransferase A [Chloroflexota bacterium]